MLTRMNDNIFRWWTPDPEEENLMAGHLVTTSDGFVLIDPPVVPGLGDFLERFGRAHAIILTTHDHTRGSRYLSDRFGAPILVPEQADEARLAQGRVVAAGAYRDGQTLPGGITARRVPVWVDQSLYLDEMLLIRGDAALLGDVASGRLDGSIECCPEQFVPGPRQSGSVVPRTSGIRSHGRPAVVARPQLSHQRRLAAPIHEKKRRSP